MTVLESQDRRGVDWYGMAVNTLRTEPPGFKSFRDYLLHSTEIVTGDCTQPRGAYLSPPLESKVCRGCILPALLSAFIGTWRVWKWRARGGSHVLNQMRTHAHSGFDILIIRVIKTFLHETSLWWVSQLAWTPSENSKPNVLTEFKEREEGGRWEKPKSKWTF